MSDPHAQQAVVNLARRPSHTKEGDEDVVREEEGNPNKITNKQGEVAR